MDATTPFKGKKITLMGLGLLGRGVGDARYLAECGAELIVTDMKTEEELKPSIDALAGLPITFHLGGHDLADFRDRDLILKAPKTPVDSIYIVEAKKHGIPVSMSTALFAKYAREVGATLVGITGTRGKTTTTEMIAHILRTTGKHILLGGNIRGVSTLALLPNVTPDTIAVLELDSWQLQGFGEEKISPDVAVFTTFYPDHMDYYDSMEAYLDDKAQIFLHQDHDDTLVLGEQARSWIEKQYAGRIRSRVQGAGTLALDDEPMLRVPGEHNRYDARLAAEAARALGVDFDESKKALESFTGVAGRLELVREAGGVSFYNDTTATTPEATLAALHAFEGKGIILIMGGADKGLDMNTLLLEAGTRAKRIIMLPGSGTDRVLEFLPGASVFDSMDAVVREAAQAGMSGDVVLLSPGFASFGLFKNEYDRGDQFDASVRALSV